MSKQPIPTWHIVVVVVRKDDKFLLVHESKHGQKWYFPAGRIEPREDFISAARRETLEEAGIPIEIEGILHIQHTPILDGSARVRFILIARPIDETPPKSIADEESLEAKWLTLNEMRELQLRGIEVFNLCHAVENGAIIYPLDLISSEMPIRKA